ncbi:MAG: PEP-CTERM sorting domain-containing protein [Phycisphaeraceae bacterium]
MIWRSTTHLMTMALAIGVLSTGPVFGQGQGVERSVGPAGEGNDEVLLELDPNGIDATGLRFRNLSEQSGTVSISRSNEPLPTLATIGSPYDEPFRMIDNTLLEIDTSAFADGRMRLRIRMGYEGRVIRQAGLRARTLHLMRFHRRWDCWQPAVFAIRDVRRMDFRFFPNRQADFTLGHFGVDQENQYVWAVIDTNGTYAIAGVPEPATMSLMFAAGGLAVMLHRRRGAAAR